MDQNDFMPLLALLMLAGIPAIFFGVGIWILRPIDQAGRNRQGSTKFSIADFLSLFVTVQVPMSLLAIVRNEVYGAQSYRIIILVLAWVVGPLIWWTAAKAISQAGIQHGWRRIVLMAVVIPVVYYGLLPFSVAIMFCCLGIISDDIGISTSDMRWSIALTVFLGCALLLCGITTRKIVATLDEEREEITD